MRFVPNLIPDQSRVLPEYFKGDLYEASKKNPVRDTLLWISGVSFLLVALTCLIHPWLLLLFGIIGFILIPPGRKFIEKKFCFRLTSKIRVVTCATLFIIALPLINYYSRIDLQIVHQQKLLDERMVKEKEISERKASLRKDSLDYYVRRARQLSSDHKNDEALKQLEHASGFVGSPSDNDLIAKEKVSIVSIKTLSLVKAGKYKAALPDINALLESDPSNTELQYSRALCYSKTGEIQEAVNALKPLVQAGNMEAEKLHDKINPIRKRVVGTETLCCDGTISYSTGSGTCSHHRGVCDWNHPIYEEYRKYD